MNMMGEVPITYGHCFPRANPLTIFVRLFRHVDNSFHYTLFVVNSALGGIGLCLEYHEQPGSRSRLFIFTIASGINSRIVFNMTMIVVGLLHNYIMNNVGRHTISIITIASRDHRYFSINGRPNERGTRHRAGNRRGTGGLFFR